jgi:hypothetical protein
LPVGKTHKRSIWRVEFIIWIFFIIIWGPGASRWSMDDRSLVMSDWQRVLDWLLA